MVRGVSGRIIVVKNPDRQYFEEAIFILRNDAITKAGVSEKEVLRQAKRAARAYLRGGELRSSSKRGRKGLLWTLLAAAATAGAWFAVQTLTL